jgi:hypothetical protein
VVGEVGKTDEQLLREHREAVRQRRIRRLRANEREMHFWMWFIPLCIVLGVIGGVIGLIWHAVHPGAASPSQSAPTFNRSPMTCGTAAGSHATVGGVISTLKAILPDIADGAVAWTTADQTVLSTAGTDLSDAESAWPFGTLSDRVLNFSEDYTNYVMFNGSARVLATDIRALVADCP